MNFASLKDKPIQEVSRLTAELPESLFHDYMLGYTDGRQARESINDTIRMRRSVKRFMKRQRKHLTEYTEDGEATDRFSYGMVEGVKVLHRED